MNLFKTKGYNKHLKGLTEELKAIYVYDYFKENNNFIVCVFNTLYEANLFFQRLSSYTKDILFYPMDDFLTSEALAASPELKITRLETINQILDNKKKIIVTNLMGYLRYLPPKKIIEEKSINLKINEDSNIKDLINKLFDLGYEKEILVSKTGEFSSRGFVLDIFPVSCINPIRIEFFGDTIESIRKFNVDTQLTIEKLEEITILPNTEFLTEKKVELEARKQKNIKKYLNPTNITGILTNPIVFYNDYNKLKQSYNLLEEEIFNYNLSINVDSNTKYMHDFNDLKEKYISFDDFDNILKDESIEVYDSREIFPFTGTKDEINKRLNNYIKDKKKVIICLSDKYKINKLIEYLDNDLFIITNIDNIFENKINLIKKNISQGFEYNNYIVISETEIFNKKQNNYKYNTKFKLGTRIRDINKLKVGDYVVHSLYGIGKYIGIKTLNKNGVKKDYIYLEYKGSDKLYIPVERIDLINKYSSNEGVEPKLNKLGSIEWEKTKLRVKKKIESIAGDLLKLYTIRKAKKGFAFKKDDELQKTFEKEFIYTETPDQLKVTEEIKRDMESDHPMDRLLCGDVGFGKTEVAFRAIFKAILSNKQAALLCPTTILSNQHYENAVERFKNYPIRIELLNRYVSKEKTNKIIKDLQDGKIDLLIGTHRILSDDIKFNDLGLLIIDEEQRFGVKHKEKIKQYKNNIDVLTLSATPIPRTLQMSITGLRSMSLIETPPVDRYPIQTYVLAENKQIIKDAIYKELSRNGQIFILYNNISDMEQKQAEIQELVPNAKIITAHGKLQKNELERVITKFINHEYDILLCTTIIETGIDMPNVNTLIIMDADLFGLSQLYQIRGRVGRSNKIAYCYLMYNNKKILKEVATKRLKVIKEFTELGSGLSIALRDLSIRGAGDVLGGEQSGFIDAVGIDLFLSMLDDEVKKLNGENIENEEKDSTSLIDVTTSIEDSYVEDTDLKLLIHKKINEINSYEKLEETKAEIEDRFGKIDNNILIYMYEQWFEKIARKLNITDIKQTNNFIEIKLPVELTDKINAKELFIETMNLSRMFRFSLKMKRIVITLDIIKLDKHFIYYLIDLVKLIEKNIRE